MDKSDRKDKVVKADQSEPAPARRQSSAGGQARAFKRVNYVLNNVMTKLGLDRRLRENALLNLWPALVGEPWSSRSRPIFIDSELKLVVAVSDASTGQELSLLKSDILRKVRTAGRSIGVEISGLRFDLKHFHGPQEQYVLPNQTPAYPEPCGEDLESVTLLESDLAEISQLKASLASDPETAQAVSSERIVAVFEKELRLRHWMRQNSFPVCQFCDNPTRTLHGPNKLCVTCFSFNRFNSPS